jgi:hypothetical protein
MNRSVANQNHTMPTLRGPVIASLAVAIFGILGILLVDHGPWNKPHLQTAQVNYGTTSAAAKAVGAKVMPTAPKPALEPVAPGPKRAQPVDQVPP